MDLLWNVVIMDLLKAYQKWKSGDTRKLASNGIPIGLAEEGRNWTIGGSSKWEIDINRRLGNSEICCSDPNFMNTL